MELTFNPLLRHGKYMRAIEGLKALPYSASTGGKKEEWPNESAKLIDYFLVLTLNNLFRNSWWVWGLCCSPQVSVEPNVNRRGIKQGENGEEAFNQSGSLHL